MTKLRTDVLFLSMVISFIATGQTIVFPILPDYLERFGGGEFEFGLSASIYALFGVIFSPIIGKVADNVGKKRVLVIQILIFGLVNFLILTAGSFFWFLVFRAIEGLVGTSTFPIAIAIVSDITEENEKARNIAFVTAGISFGIIIGPTLGGFLLDNYGIQYPYLVSGILGLIGSLLTFLLITEKKVSRHTFEEEEKGILVKLPRPIYVFFILLIMTFINGATWMMIEPGFIYYFYNVLGYSATDFGIFVSAYGIFIFLGEVLLGGLSDRFGRKPILIFGAIINAGFYYILGVAQSYTVLVVAAAIAGIAGGLLGPALNALISEVSDERYRSFVFGIVTSAGSLATILGPFFGGWYLSIGNSIQSLIFISVALVSLNIIFPLFLNFKTKEKKDWQSSQDEPKVVIS